MDLDGFRASKPPERAGLESRRNASISPRRTPQKEYSIVFLVEAAASME